MNRNEIREVTDDIFLKALRTAQQIAVYTEGAYDITCAPLINLWGFGYNNQDSVSPEHIDSVTGEYIYYPFDEEIETEE